MTFLYPQLPSTEAAPTLLAKAASTPYGPVSQHQFLSLPEPASQTGPSSPPNPAPNEEYIRHLLIGSPEAIRATIHLLQARRYVDHALWSGPLPIGDNGIHITHNEGQAIAYLMRRRSLDRL